jgi:hypothetical protein
MVCRWALRGVVGPVDLRRGRYRELLRAKFADEVGEMLAADDADAPREHGRTSFEVVLDVARVLELRPCR